MTYRVEFTDAAQSDARDAYRYIALRSSSNAERWFARLRRAAESLSEFPQRCPIAPEAKYFREPIRQRLFGVYRILFVIRKPFVYVLHIRHGARRTLRPDVVGDR